MDGYKLGDVPGVYSFGKEKIKDVNEVSKSYICSTRLPTLNTQYTALFCCEDKCKENTDIYICHPGVT